MSVLAAPRPIPGKVLDPPRADAPELVRRLEETDGTTSVVAGVGYRAMSRFTFARATLLAAGTTYYVFLAMFSLLAMAYGVTALLGADRIADYLTSALTEAFPGLIGDDGIDPAQLKAVGQTASIVGLVVMLYSGAGAMTAASGSMHLIYGAAPDPRNYVVKRLRLLGWLLVIGPLLIASLVAGIATQNFSSRVMEWLGWDGITDRVVMHALAVAVTLLLDFLVVWVILRQLGGIRPHRRPLVIGSIVGAVAIQLLRLAMGAVLTFSADKPQYGALTLPIGILFVLYLNSVALFGVAALTAAIAERDLPLDDLVPTIDEIDAADEVDVARE